MNQSNVVVKNVAAENVNPTVIGLTRNIVCSKSNNRRINISAENHAYYNLSCQLIIFP